MYRSIELAQALSVSAVIDAIDRTKADIEVMQPVPEEVHARIMQKFRLHWNYHSNAIEGNPFTYGETVAFLMEGITVKGKTLKDHLDIKGHDEAVRYLLEAVKGKDYILTEAEIRNLHKMILKEPYWSDAITPEGIPTKKLIRIGEYKTSSNSVLTPTGEMHYYTTPEETPVKMGELMEWYRTITERTDIHPVTVTALFHHQFTAIHPFDDGNGRLARLLLNLMLMRYGYPPVVIKQQDRNNYYAVLRQADAGEYRPVVEYMAEQLQTSLDLYLKGARGESIEETDDIDKEIALFKKGLGEDVIKSVWGSWSVYKTMKSVLLPFALLLDTKLGQLKELFIKYKSSMAYEYKLYVDGEWLSPLVEDIMPDKPEPPPKEWLPYVQYLNFKPVVTPEQMNDFLSELEYSEHAALTSVQFDFLLECYKKVNNPFNIAIRVDVTFNMFGYVINAGDYLAGYGKKYRDGFSDDETNTLISIIIKNILSEIEQKSET
jgi:Fic family protein